MPHSAKTFLSQKRKSSMSNNGRRLVEDYLPVEAISGKAASAQGARGLA